MSHLILVLNCGSSSIKFALFESNGGPLPRQKRWGGKINNITSANTTYDTSDTPTTPLQLNSARPYRAALEHVQRLIDAHLQGRTLSAVAHRVVHGGSIYSAPVQVTPQVLADLKTFIPLAPLHQPYALEAIEAQLELTPGLPQIACFDTAFHHTLPLVEKILPLNWAAWERGIRRYGFHGLSYDYMSVALPERHGNLARQRVIVAHIGSGASLCGMINLQSTVTTLGFSALDGLMMGTRPGSIDPGVLLHLLQQEQRTPEEISHMLYRDAGLRGISGLSDDTRVLLQQESTNERARLALELYVRRIVKEIGALAAALGGLDLLVFTAGIGENNATIRQRVCQQLGWLGITLDETANAAHTPVISTSQSQITVGVEPTNEEWVAAQRSLHVLQASPSIS